MCLDFSIHPLRPKCYSTETVLRIKQLLLSLCFYSYFDPTTGIRPLRRARAEPGQYYR